MQFLGFLLKMPFGQFTLCPDTHVYVKNILQILARRKFAVGGGCYNLPPRPEKEEVAAKINKFRNFHFLI